MVEKVGIKSGEVRREKKTMQETLDYLLSLDVNPERRKELEKFGVTNNEDMTNKYFLCYKLIEKAMTGNTRAFEVIRDTLGEKPTTNANVEIETPVIVVDLLDD